MFIHVPILLGVLWGLSDANAGPEFPSCAEEVLVSLDEWFEKTGSFDLSYTVERRVENPQTSETLEDHLVKARAVWDGEKRRFASQDGAPKPQWGNCSPNDWDVSFDGTRTIRRECGVYYVYDSFHEAYGHVLPTQLLHTRGLRAYLKMYKEGNAQLGADALTCEAREDGHVQITFIWDKDKHGPGVYGFAEQWVVHRDRPYMVIEQRSYKKGGTYLNSEVIDIRYQQLESGQFYPVHGRENLLTEEGEVWQSESVEVALAASRIGAVPLPNELFEIEIPAGSRVERPSGEGVSMIDSPCGSDPSPSPCSEEAGSSLEKLASQQDELPASLSKTVALAREVSPPSGEATSGFESTEPQCRRDALAVRAHLEGWRVGAWAGAGALFVLVLNLMFMKVVKFADRRREG